MVKIVTLQNSAKPLMCFYCLLAWRLNCTSTHRTYQSGPPQTGQVTNQIEWHLGWPIRLQWWPMPPLATLLDTPLFFCFVLFCFFASFHFRETKSHEGIATQLLKWSVTCLIYPSCCFCRATDRCQTHTVFRLTHVQSGSLMQRQSLFPIGSFDYSANELNPKAVIRLKIFISQNRGGWKCRKRKEIEERERV